MDLERIFSMMLAIILTFLFVSSNGNIGDLQNPNILSSSNSSSTPSADVTSLADKAGMTDKAKQIFYKTNPEIDTDKSVFTKNCHEPYSSQVIELGCYTSDNRIYILNIGNPALQDEMVVTAAHEMLHAAYTQLSLSEKNSVSRDLEVQVSQMNNPQLEQEIRLYMITEPGQTDNELHSLLGTEYPNLSPDLENYYSQYFQNRQNLVDYYHNFAQSFSGSYTSRGLENAINQNFPSIAPITIQKHHRF